MSTHSPARPSTPVADGPGYRGTLDDWCPSRRSMMRTLAAIGGVTLVPGLLVACSNDDAGTTEGSGGSSSSDAGSGDEGGSASGSSIAASEVAVGTAVVVQVDGAPYVVAQPSEGDYVAFDARCTHQGTTVEAGDGLTLVCPNHGSEFDAGDAGAVLQGPATSALAPVDVTLEGDQLVLG